MSKYKKLIAVLVGFAALKLKEHIGLDLGKEVIDQVVDIMIMALTALSVYWTRNEK